VLMDSPAETLDGLHGSPDLPVHAAARVEQNPNTHRYVLILAEMRNLLRLAVFFKNEIVGRQVWNRMAAIVRDCCGHVDQTHIHAHLSRSDDGNRQRQCHQSKYAWGGLKPACHVNSRAALYYDSAIM